MYSCTKGTAGLRPSTLFSNFVESNAYVDRRSIFKSMKFQMTCETPTRSLQKIKSEGYCRGVEKTKPIKQSVESVKCEN